MMAKALVRPILGALLCVVVTACSLFESGPQPPCPLVMKLGGAERVTVFRPGPGRDITDVLYEGEMTQLSAHCQYDEDDTVDVEATVEMVFSRGPAMEGDTGHFEYFVAVMDPEERILAKKVFPIDVTFPAGLTRVAVTEELAQHIVVHNRPDASGHRVIVGFQLTPEQLEYQRGGGS